ncbi:MAG: ATP-binding protein [Oceanipulchritudo sp.]
MKSITRYLTSWLVFFFIALWLLCSVLLYTVIRGELADGLDARLQERIEGITTLVEVEADGSLSMDYEEGSIRDFAQGEDNSYFQIWDSDGGSFIRSGSLDGQDLPVSPTARVPLAWEDYVLPNGLPGRIVWIHFYPRYDFEENSAEAELFDQAARDRKPKPLVTAALAVSRKEMDDFLHFMTIWLVVIGLGSLIALVFITRRTVKMGLLPLHTLGQHARKMDILRQEETFPLPDPEELHEITNRLNELLGRIRSSFDREKLFSANVMHDLRTPVAELRAIMEVARRYHKDDATAREKALEEGHAIALEIESLLHSLHALLELQSTNTRDRDRALDEVNPLKLVNELLPSYTEGDGALRWQLTGPADFSFPSVEAAYANALRQLLGNASDYAPPGSLVEVRLLPVEADQQVEIIVVNEAADLVEADLARIFDAFRRGSTHRTNRTHQGLGLSIARASAELIGGRLVAELLDGKVAFHFTVPWRGR